MDPLTQPIVYKLLTNAACTFIGKSVSNVSKALFSNQSVEDTICGNFNIDFLLEQREDEIYELIETSSLPSNVDMDSIRVFFKYPYIHNIVGQIYSSHYDKIISGINDMNDIRQEFNLLFSYYFNVTQNDVHDLSGILFEILIGACEDAAKNIIINNQELSAHEAESEYRHQFILDKIEQVSANVNLLLNKKLDIKDIHEFAEKYRQTLNERCEYLKSASFDGNVRKPIEDIYVCPDFIKLSDSSGNKNKKLNYEHLLSNICRAVILGDPGTGKTTFTQKLSYDLTNKKSCRLLNGREILPFTVVLREYQTHNSENNHSILDFIENTSNSSFQIRPPEGAIEYLLLNGYMLIIFDGLDELLDISHREKIRDQIESFCSQYPAVPIIITSRKIGYENASLRDDLFEKHELSVFSRGQIEEYVNKWFEFDFDLEPQDKQRKAASFLRESQIVGDILSNSLMLSLLCNIYKQENYIPENRPKVYRKCADMLFEKWDRHRDINPNIIIPNSKIKSLIAYLAFWIFENEPLQKGVTENKLIIKAAEYLFDYYDDQDEARNAAEDFINFCKGRAWVFTDVGSTKNESLYQFTHRTFLEYFASDWLNRNNQPQELVNILLPKIIQGEWDVVAQLAFQIKDDISEGASDVFFSTLIDKSKTVDEESKHNLLSFAVRSLEFMILKPKIIRDIITSYFNYLLSKGIENLDKIQNNISLFEGSTEPYSKVINLLLEVQKSGFDNRKIVSSILTEQIKDKVIGSKNEAIIAIEIITIIFEEGNDYWRQFSHNLIKDCYFLNKSLFEDNLHISIAVNEILWEHPIEYLLKIQGLKVLLYDYSLNIQPHVRTSGIGSRLLISSSNIPYSELESIGSWCLSAQFPFQMKKSIQLPITFLCKTC